MTSICPYPGLRPFTEEESIFFKGRDLHIEQVTKQLEQKKFVMLTGASGDGKSSLIYAGVIPNARAGFFKAKHNNWVFVTFRPEKTPLENFAKSLSQQLKTDFDETKKELSFGFSSLVNLYKSAPEELKNKKRKAANLFILVDQFEELFTNPENYANGRASKDAQTIVNLLLETANIALNANLPIYIVCTMRSDYIGQCAAFRGLPEMIGFSQFFVPRLKRKEIHSVIEEPAILSGNKITPRLTETLINELNEGFDQLPVLQHVLNGLWHATKITSEKTEMDLIHLSILRGLNPSYLSADDKNIYDAYLNNKPEYWKIYHKNFSLSQALSSDADLLFEMAHDYFYQSEEVARWLNSDSYLKQKKLQEENNLSKDEIQQIIKITFQCLTKIDDNRAVRHRTTLQRITEIIDNPRIDCNTVCRAINFYREQGNTFIYPFINENPESRNLKPETVLDITHEALIRNWERLKQWADEENESYHTFLDLNKQLQRWNSNGRTTDFLLPAGTLTYFEEWYKKQKPNKWWLARYSPASSAAKSPLRDVGGDDRASTAHSEKLQKAEQTLSDINLFLSESRREIEKVVKRKRSLRRLAFAVLCAMVIGAIGFSYYATTQRNEANNLARISKSDQLATMALLKLEDDPTLSFRLAEEAYRLNREGILAIRAMTNAFNKGGFHNIIENKFPQDWGGGGVVFLTDSAFIGLDSVCKIYDVNGKVLIELTGHKSAIKDFSVSKDKSRIATFADDSLVKVWNNKGEFLFDLIGHTGKITWAGLSNNNIVATTSKDSSMILWDINGKIIKRIPGFFVGFAKFSYDSKVMTSIADSMLYFISTENGDFINKIKLNAKWTRFEFSPNKKQCVFILNGGSKDNVIALYDFYSNKILKLTGHNGIMGFNENCFSNDGERLVTFSRDSTAIVWDKNGKRLFTLEGHKGMLADAEFSSEGKYILTAGWDEKVAKLWDAETGKEIFTTDEHDQGLREWTKFSKYGKYIATAGWFNSAKIWDLKGNLIADLKGHSGTIIDIQFSPDNKYVVTSSMDNTRRIWEIKELNNILKGHENEVVNAKYSSSGKYIITVSWDSTAKIWNKYGNLLHTLKGHKKDLLQKIHITSDEKFILTASSDSTLILWDINGNKIFEKKVVVTYDESCFSFSNDGKSIYAASSDTNHAVIQYSISGDTLAILKGHKEPVLGIACSGNGKYIATTAGYDSTLCLWDEKGNLIRKMKENNFHVALPVFSPDNKYIVTQSGTNITIWDINGNKLHDCEGHTGVLFSITFSPDGKHFISTSNDNTARIWNFKGELIQELKGHKDVLWSAVYSPDGKYVLTASGDKTARIWAVDPEEILRLVNDEKVYGKVRPFTHDEKKEYGVEL